MLMIPNYVCLIYNQLMDIFTRIVLVLDFRKTFCQNSLQIIHQF